MVDVTEQAKQAYKSAIIGFLRERCKTDTYLAEACKKENKTLDGCVKYIIGEARKKAENNVAFVPDEEVYDWAVHYILEDSLNGESGKNDEIETPFATAEIKIGNSLTVNQCYGDRDRTVPEVEDFVSAWLKYSNKQYKKLQGA